MEIVIQTIIKPDSLDFWLSLASNLIAAILFAVLFPYYLQYFKRPKKLELFFRRTGGNSISITKEGGRSNYDIELAFRHLSGETFKSGLYWHIYIPKYLNPAVVSLGPNTLPKQRDEIAGGKVYVHFSGKITEPIFTGTTHWFHYKFSGSFDSELKQLENKSFITLYYFISTEYGYYPKHLKSDLLSGEIDVETANKLILNL